MSNPVAPLTPQQTEAVQQKSLHDGYIHRSLVGFDDFVNVLLDGNPDETISARVARWAVDDHGLKHDLGIAVCTALGDIQKNHDAKAVAADAERAKKLLQIEDNSGIINSESD